MLLKIHRKSIFRYYFSQSILSQVQQQQQIIVVNKINQIVLNKTLQKDLVQENNNLTKKSDILIQRSTNQQNQIDNANFEYKVRACVDSFILITEELAENKFYFQTDKTQIYIIQLLLQFCFTQSACFFNILICYKLTNIIIRIYNIIIVYVSSQFLFIKYWKKLRVSNYRILCNLFNKLMNMQSKHQPTQNIDTKLQAYFQPYYNNRLEPVQYKSLPETDKYFIKILVNLYEYDSIENTTADILINDARACAKQIFCFYNKKCLEIEQLEQRIAKQRKCVEELNIMIDEYKEANDELKTINQKNETYYQKQIKQFEWLKHSWEISKKELEQAQRKNKEQSQKIRLLNKDIEIQKEFIMSLKKKINSLENQICDMKKNNIELQRDKQRLENQLKVLTEELTYSKDKNYQKLDDVNTNKGHYKGLTQQDVQSVYSIVSVAKIKDNIDILKQAQIKNQFDKYSRKSSMDGDNSDYDLDINLNKKCSFYSNVNIPQFSERQTIQQKNVRPGHQRMASEIEHLKKKSNNNVRYESKIDKKASEIKRNPPKQSEEYKQKRILRQNLNLKEKELQQILKKFQEYKKQSQRQSDNQRIDLTLLQGQFELEISQLRARAEHEKVISKKFMKENIDLKLKCSRLMEAAKKLYAEKDYAQKYYSQYLQQKCKQFIKQKSVFLEQRTQQIKIALNMLMQFYKKWIIDSSDNQFYESQKQKNRRVELENIILKLNGGDLQTIKKVRFRKSRNNNKKKITKGKLQAFDIEDVFKDQPTGDNSNIRCSNISDEVKLDIFKTENLIIQQKQRRLSRNLSYYDQKDQVLSEMQLSLTLDEDSKFQFRENNEDSMSESRSKKEIQNHKTANETPNKQVQTNFTQTQNTQFYHENVVKRLFPQNDQSISLSLEIQTQLQTRQFQIQATQFIINAETASQFAVQTMKQISQQYIQTQIRSHEIQIQVKPILFSIESQTYSQITNNKETQTFYTNSSAIQTQPPQQVQKASLEMQTQGKNMFDQQNQTTHYNQNQEQQTEQTFFLKSETNCLGIQSQIQDFYNVSVQTYQSYKLLRLDILASQHSDFSQQTQLFTSKSTQTQLHFQLFDFSLQTQNTGFGKIPLTQEQFLSIQTKTKGSKIEVQSIASSQGLHEQVEQKQQTRKWTFYNPQNMNKLFQQRMELKPLKKMQKQKAPRLSSKSHKVEKDESSSLIIDVSQIDCKELPPQRILEKLVSKPIGSIIYLQKFQEINNKFKWNKDKYYMIEAQSQKDGTKEKFLVWKKGIFSMISRKYLKLKLKGLCFSDPEMINIGNSEIVIRGQQALIRKKQNKGYMTGGLENGTWKIINCSLYDSRK